MSVPIRRASSSSVAASDAKETDDGLVDGGILEYPRDRPFATRRRAPGAGREEDHDGFKFSGTARARATASLTSSSSSESLEQRVLTNRDDALVGISADAGASDARLRLSTQRARPQRVGRRGWKHGAPTPHGRTPRGGAQIPRRTGTSSRRRPVRPRSGASMNDRMRCGARRERTFVRRGRRGRPIGGEGDVVVVVARDGENGGHPPLQWRSPSTTPEDPLFQLRR